MQRHYGLIMAFFLGSVALAFGQPLPYTAQQRAQIEQTRQVIQQQQDDNYQRAVQAATERGRPLSGIGRNGAVFRLHGITETGELLYVTTYNAQSAATTRTTSLYAGGSLGVDLSGSSATVQNRLGIWDGGRVRGSHKELSGRVSQMDNPSGTAADEHATHVSGTMMATGLNANAKGMAYRAKLQAWDFNSDVSEMTAASPNLLVSNHSYGTIAGWYYNDSRTGSVQWEWYGDTTISQTEDYKFGLYDSNTRSWDLIANNAPNYLIVKAAGNDHGPTGPGPGGQYYYNNKLTTTNRSDQSGYDQISTYGTAKNILSVAAISALTRGYNQPSDVNLAYFSSWGPTDDGRIKPDIAAVGVNVFSLDNPNDSAYTTLDGTSMATPNVSGSMLLLQEYYAQLNASKLMRSSTLRGLVLHTASEAGPSPGPDYQYGWGLLNVERAGQVLKNADKSNLIDERTINQGETYTLPVVASGKGPLTVTICWNDPAGTATSPSKANLNNRTPKLVNDLDVRVTDGTQSRLPWTLNPDQPSTAATPGDNIRDNIEQVLIANPVPGKSYTITINHKGTLTNTKQDYALIVSGIGGTAYCASGASTSADSRIDGVQFGTISKAGTGGCTTYTDNTTLVADAQAGQTVPLSVTTGTCGATQNTIVKAFIDWNLDGAFDPATETVATSGALASGSVFSANILVPPTVVSGQFTRLRIVEVATTDPAAVSPCGTYAVGETQDFSLRFVPVANDVGIAALVSPNGSFCGQSGDLVVSVQVQNFGSTTQASVPVSVTVLDQNNVVLATLNSSYSGLGAYRTGLVSIPTTLVLQPGQTYRFVASTTLTTDQVTANNLLSTNVVSAPLPTVGNYQASSCGPTGTVSLVNTGGGTATWFDAPTGGNLLAAGNNVLTTVHPTNNVYYVSQNEFSGKLGPATKAELGSGSYGGAYITQPLISTKVPLVLTTARLYIGTAGRLTFSIKRLDETVVSSTTLDVVPTRTLPASATAAGGQLTDDPNDPGAIYPLNLQIPVAGNYKLTVDYGDGVTIFRSTTAIAGSTITSSTFPFSIPGIISSKGSLFANATTGTIDTLTSAWYYVYNLQVRPLTCGTGQRTAVQANITTAPAASISANGSLSICQGTAVTLTASTDATGATYQWLNGNAPIAGATSATYQASSSGNYAVSIGGACQTLSAPVAVVVRVPLAPTVTQSGLMLTSSAASGNQWLLNGVVIAGATSATYAVSQTGRYSVRASVNGCGEAVSDEVYVTILATEPLVADDLFRIYPNPATKQITVEAAAGSGPAPTLQLIDARGIVVNTSAMAVSGKIVTATVDVSTLPGGVFFVQLLDDSNQAIRVKRFSKP